MATVLVTGAARGVGRATAVAFAEEGADLLLVDVCEPIEGVPYELGTHEHLEETAERCRRSGARVLGAPVDVRSQEEIDAAVARGARELGTVSVLVNNAGLVGPAGSPAHELDESEWTLVLDVNVSGPWRCAKAVLPGMVAAGGGSIVNVASTGGLVGFRLFANYVTAKHALIGLTRALALDYAEHGIRVNAVCPTSVRDRSDLDSAMLGAVADMLGATLDEYEELSVIQHPLGRLVEAEDVAAAAIWLASEAARSITGAVIAVDGGFTAR
jgi:NAD(P)-dependent dehydrogenase (short-subunit alcohol dehydrogenase family)